jgi:Protein of unknown function (DUF3237)
VTPIAADPAAAPRLSLTRHDVRFLLEMQVNFHPAPIYATPLGTRMVFAVKDGWFHGPGLKGTVLPGSADWMTVGSDGIGRIDVRATLLTDDGDHIYMSNTGRVVLGEHSARLFSGERVTSDEAYIRTSPLFETGSARHADLNSVSTIGLCDISLSDIYYRVFAVA